MTGPRASDERTSRAGLDVLRFAALFIAAGSGVAFFWIGDLSEQVQPQYADYLWRPWAFLAENETPVGIVCLVAFVAAGSMLLRARRGGRMPPPALAQVVVLTLFSAWLGASYRVLTAGVIGANIGGGLVMLATPVVAALTLAAVVGLGLHGRRSPPRIG